MSNPAEQALSTYDGLVTDFDSFVRWYEGLDPDVLDNDGVLAFLNTEASDYWDRYQREVLGEDEEGEP